MSRYLDQLASRVQITTYKQFVAEVQRLGFTKTQIRCDVPPTQEVLDFLDRIEANNYERFATRYCR